MTEIECLVSGKVQNVMYRTYVQDSATLLGLVGYVQNNDDGTVKVVVHGMPDELKGFIEYLNEGSSLSTVDTIAVDWQTPKVTYEEFSVLY